MSLQIFCGDDKVLTATVYTDATLTTPVNLTGLVAATFLVKTRTEDADAAALITKKLGAGIVVTNAAGGVLTITLTAAETVAMATLMLVCALKLKDSGGQTATVYSDALMFVKSAVNIAV